MSSFSATQHLDKSRNYLKIINLNMMQEITNILKKSSVNNYLQTEYFCFALTYDFNISREKILDHISAYDLLHNENIPSFKQIDGQQKWPLYVKQIMEQTMNYH